MGVYGDVSPAMWASYSAPLTLRRHERANNKTAARKPIATHATGEDALYQHALDPWMIPMQTTCSSGQEGRTPIHSPPPRAHTSSMV